VTTFYFIRRGDLETTVEIADILLEHPYDLIHKAVRWMLRELGKQNEALLVGFLEKHYSQMPRTMLRYAIEKFPQPARRILLQGKFYYSTSAQFLDRACVTHGLIGSTCRSVHEGLAEVSHSLNCLLLHSPLSVDEIPTGNWW